MLAPRVSLTGAGASCVSLIGKTSRFGLFDAYATVATGSDAEDEDETGGLDDEESGAV